MKNSLHGAASGLKCVREETEEETLFFAEGGTEIRYHRASRTTVWSAKTSGSRVIAAITIIGFVLQLVSFLMQVLPFAHK